LNAATDAGVNKTFGFKSSRFKVVSEESDSIYLTEKELNDIYSFDFSENKRLEKVRDLFIVGSWTGLRFSDFTKLSEDHIKEDFLEIETQKTGEKVVIPIHSIVKDIFKKYKNEIGLCLPQPISNAKMNEYLKEIGKEITAKNKDISLNQDVITTITRGGKKVSTRDKKYDLITTHTARRSFASNLFLDGVPALTIMKITGHKTERAFLKYIKITLNENAKILQMHWKNKELSKEPLKELSIAN
jgi:integrase